MQSSITSRRGSRETPDVSQICQLLRIDGEKLPHIDRRRWRLEDLHAPYEKLLRMTAPTEALARHPRAHGESETVRHDAFSLQTLGGDGSVHVWQVPIPCEEAVEALEQMLSVAERHRAKELLVPHARAAFVSTRAALRQLLSGYLGVRPMDVTFQLGSFGKPRLATNHDSRLRFNVSHAREISLCAVAWGRDIGVDVEAHLDGADLVRLAERVCAPDELQQLRTTAGDDHVSSFYRCWSKKEAILKATGDGLSLPTLPLLDVLSRPGSLILRGEMPSLARGTWQVHDVDVGPGYSAAVAFRSEVDGKEEWIA
jgi:4'-phosphopantetheinyl transferase